MLIRNRVFNVEGYENDQQGVIVLRELDSKKLQDLEPDINEKCFAKYGFYPVNITENKNGISDLMLNQLSVEEFRLILKYDYWGDLKCRTLGLLR